MSKTFYDAKGTNEALRLYLKANDTVYDHLKNKALKRFLLKYLSPIKDKKILEVGSGGGIWTRLLLAEGAKVTAVDLHSAVLDGNKKLNPGAKFVFGDATNIQLGEKFHIILAKDIIEHILEDDTFLKNMRDHLCNGGHLLVTTQNSFSLNYLIEGGSNFIHGNKNWCGWDPTHIRFYNYFSLKDKLKKAELTPIKWWGTYHFPYRYLTRKILRRLIEWKGFHLVELLNLNDKFPFSLTGWGIGVLVKKTGSSND